MSQEVTGKSTRPPCVWRLASPRPPLRTSASSNASKRKQILQAKVLDLNAVIPEIEKMLRRLIGEDIVLETVLDRSLGQVKADPGQMEQILMNLCVNARDAMLKGGRLTIQTANISLKQSYRNQPVFIRAGNYGMLSVCYNGCVRDA